MQNFFQLFDQHRKQLEKKTGVQLELLTDIDILLVVEKGIRGVMCFIIRHYTKANNKCIKDYDKNKESSYLKYCDVNDLYKVRQCTKVSSKWFSLGRRDFSV